MGQNNRQLIRLFFILVIGAGLIGGRVVSQRFPVNTLTFTQSTSDSNWMDMLATIGEETIQLFLGLTSGQ